VWREYQDDGLVVWGIASQDPLAQLISFRDQMGLTYPVLYDEGASVHTQYMVEWAFSTTVYPQDWIIGVDGTVVYVNNGYKQDEMTAIIEEELAKME